jgi:hypothetical protein
MTHPDTIQWLPVQGKIRQTASEVGNKEIDPISQNLDHNTHLLPRELYRTIAHTVTSVQAKLFTPESVQFVAGRAVQSHGGYSYVEDFSNIEKLYRDARVISIYKGTLEI